MPIVFLYSLTHSYLSQAICLFSEFVCQISYYCLKRFLSYRALLQIRSGHHLCQILGNGGFVLVLNKLPVFANLEKTGSF